LGTTKIIDVQLRFSTAQFTAGIKQANMQLGVFNKTVGRVQRTMVAFAALFIARGLFRGMKAVVKQAGDLQFQMVQIQRITGLSAESVDGFKDALLELSTEVVASVSELSELAIVAARAGVRTEAGMIQIARAASMMAELSDMSAVQTTNALIKIIKAMGLATSDAQAVGSAIVGVAKTVAATEGEISQAVMRMASSGRMLGLTVPDLTALAGVTIELGVDARRTGTLWNRAFIQMVKNADKAAKVMGITRAAFKKMIDDDATRAVTLLLDKLSEIPSGFEKLKKGTSIFQMIGIRGVGPVINNMDNLHDKLSIASKKFLEQKQLAEDYTMVMGTFNVTMKLLSQSFQIAGIALGEGLLGPLKEFAETLRKKVLNLRPQIEEFGLKIGFVVEKITEFVAEKDNLEGIATGIKAIALAIGASLLPVAILATAKLAALVIGMAALHDIVLKAPLAYTKASIKFKEFQKSIAESKAGKLYGKIPGTDIVDTDELNREIQELKDIQKILEDNTDMDDSWLAQLTEMALNAGLSIENISKLKEELTQLLNAAGEKPEGDKDGDEDPLGAIASFVDNIKTQLADLDSFNVMIADGLTGVWNETWSGIEKSMSSAISTMILEGGKLSDRLKQFWEGMKAAFVNAIADMVAELAVWALKQLFWNNVIMAASVATAKAIEIAWAGAAAVVSLATMGGNAAPAIAAIAATKAVALASVGMQKGGIVPGRGSGDIVPALLEPGELVIPKDQVGNVVNNNNPSVTVNMAGALILDDPNAIERLYREGLRDRIMTDIRTGRDTFYDG